MNSQIGPDHPCYIIAEAGVNHNGSLDRARDLVDEATKAGADAVKFQSFEADQIVTESTSTASYQQRSGYTNQHEMLSELELSREEFEEVAVYCNEQGIEFLSTPYDRNAVMLLDDLGVDRFKIASADLVNKPLLETIAMTGKQVIVSSGMATIEEIIQGLNWLREAGADDLVLLYCVSEYPTSLNDLNLRAMRLLDDIFDIPVGFSDHTLGQTAPISAVGMGATVIEKHFTLDTEMKGPDHDTSIEPDQLDDLVTAIRNCEKCLGQRVKHISDEEKANAARMRPSLHASIELEPGDRFTEKAVAIVRPADGLAPRYLDSILGSPTNKTINVGDPITWEDIA